MRRWAWLWLFLVALVVLCGASPRRGYSPVYGDRYAKGKGYAPGNGGAARVDTTKIIVRDRLFPNTAARTAGYVTAADTVGATIRQGSAGQAVRWGHVKRNTANTVYYDASTPYQSYTVIFAQAKAEDDYTWQTDAYLGFVAINVADMKPKQKVEKFDLIVNVAAFETFVVPAGEYFACRLDTIAADQAMCLSSITGYAADTDTARMDISWNEVDATGNKSWSPSLDNRLDRHDFGPRSNNLIGAGSYASGTPLKFDMRDAVQIEVDRGNVGPGKWLIFVLYGSSGQTDLPAFAAGDYASWVGGGGGKGCPTAVIRTTSLRGPQPWAGVPCPVALILDDQYPVQSGYYDALTDSGLTMDMAIYRTAAAAYSWVDSVYSLDQNKIQFVHHSRTHPSLGGLTSAQLVPQMSRAWYDSLFTAYVDTTKIVDYAWPGGGSTPARSIAAAEKMIDWKYRSCRGYGTTWTATDIAMQHDTWLSWDGYVNAYQIHALSAAAIFNVADMAEELGDLIDQAYTDEGKSALIFYGHRNSSAPADGITEADVRQFIGLTNQWASCQIMPYRRIVDMRVNSQPFMSPGDVVASAGVTADSNAIQAVAADQDSVYDLGGHQKLLKMWLGPWTESMRAHAGADVTPPRAPTDIIPFSGNGWAAIYWTGPETGESVSYRVYRFYDGANDTVLVSTTNLEYAFVSAVNGSPHNYFVTAIDAAGNESADSDHVATTPGSIITLQSPAYFAFWYQDPSDTGALSAADVAALAKYDAIVCGPFPLELSGEPAYSGLLDRVRQTNSDEVFLTYFNAFTIPADRASYAAGTAGRRIWNYCVSLPDSGGFGEKVDGLSASGDVYNVKFFNVMNTTLADTIASILVDVFDDTGVDGEYAGFFIDDADTTLPSWMCNGGFCHELIDYDQDGDTFESDPEEQAAVRTWHLDLLRAIRREFAQRGMPNRLIVANTSAARKDPVPPKDEQYLSLCDGYLNEGWNEYWPGSATETDTDKWTMALSIGSYLTHAQTSPPLVFWNAHADSSDQYMNEVIAMATAGMVGSNDDDDWHGSSAVPTMGRKNAALTFSGPVAPLFGEVAGGASADTLKISRGNLRGRMILARNAGDPDNEYAVWPYVIYTTAGDTLSRSVYWERGGEEGAPQQPGFHTQVGDNTVLVIMERCLGCTEDMADSDVRLFKIVSTADEGDGPVERTYYVSPDTLGQWDSDEESFVWRDYTVQNGFEYCYSVSVIDYLGNESPVFSPSGQCRTPVDNEAPPAVDAIVASGTEGAVEVAWTYSAAPNDFDYYRITRRIAGSGAAFAALDSVSVVAYTDDSAVGGISYNYNVRAVDDDGNVSELPETWGTGGWYGTVDPTYPAPSNVRALADNPSGYTSVVIYPPSDQTGLTSYSVYRGRYAGGAAATDTTACTLYKTGLAPDGFGGHVFVDLHATNGAAEDTAFQYTARALYSGNASEKYAVPAWALSTGGFSAQTPGCFAFGNGTNISVACMTLAGSDSTRIFRGTSAGTQSYVTTVAVANNPWTDTTALANTDYWYKLRQVDDGVVSQFSAVSGPARWTSSTGPAVTDSGDAGTTLQHGESITITGPNLGTKRPNGVGVGPPIMYDSFDNGVNGQRLTTTPRWRSYQNWDSPYGAIFADQTWYPQAVPYGNRGKCLYGAMVNGVPTDAMAYNLDFAATDTLYYSYNYRLNFWDSRLATPAYSMGTSFGQIKLGRSNRVGEDYNGRGEISFSDNQIIWNDGAGGDHSNAAYVAESQKYWNVANPSSWKRMEMFRAIPNLPATTDQYGPIWWRRNGQFIAVESSSHPDWPNSNLGNQMLRAAGQTWRIGTILLPFGWANMWQSCSTCRGEMYCDDVYVDNTQMRVEIGNNSTFNSCTERNIQIPATWTPTSITATVNTGAFADGSYYLFVLGEDGQPVATVPIVIDNP